MYNMEFPHENNMLVQSRQTSIWDAPETDLPEGPLFNPFAKDPVAEEQRRLIAQHKAWLAQIQHEYPSPYVHFRIGIYIRYFNQTKHENYLDYHKQEFIDTIAMCPNWSIVDFYIDEGQSAPRMQSAKEWCRLLSDCLSGKVNLIITQKVSNVSRNPEEVTFCARFLATQKKPIGIYFISEDIYTLASYYQADLRESGFLPGADWQLLPDEDTPLIPEGSEET